jgi:hypothetical protein
MTGGMNFCGSRPCRRGRRPTQHPGAQSQSPDPPEPEPSPPDPGTPPPEPGTPPRPRPRPRTPPRPRPPPPPEPGTPPPGSPPESPSVSPSEDEVSAILKLFRIASEGLSKEALVSKKEILMDEIIKLYADYKTQLSYDVIHKVFFKYYDSQYLNSLRVNEAMPTIRSLLDKMVAVKKRNERLLAFASALNSRLGEDSPHTDLPYDPFQQIASYGRIKYKVN